MKTDQEKFQRELKEMMTGFKKTPNFQQDFVCVDEEEETGSKKGEQEVERGRVFEKGKGGGGGDGNWKYKKMEMPLFEGNDPDCWILRSEKYFMVCRLTEEEKVDAAVVAMEGDA